MQQRLIFTEVLGTWQVKTYNDYASDIPIQLVLTNRFVSTHVKTNSLCSKIFGCMMPEQQGHIIGMHNIIGLTISKVQRAFAIHLDCEDDIYIVADRQFPDILEKLCAAFVNYNFCKLAVYLRDEVEGNKIIRESSRTICSERASAENLLYVNDNELSTLLLGIERSRIDKRGRQKPLKIEDFHYVTKLGEGTFGRVILAKKIDNQKLYAIKIQKKTKIVNEGSIQYFKTERKILEHVNHPFLVPLEYCFQDRECIYFVMKFMRGGELFAHMKTFQIFTETQTQFYAAQIVLALEYLHKMKILYRDLKPENILLDETGYIGLTDYGLSKMVNQDELADSFVGTAEYLAPELINRLPYSYQVDWWSLGILIFEMLTGKTPFFSNNKNIVYKNIIDAEVVFPPNIYVSDYAKDLITRLLNKRQKNRLGAKGASQIKSHPFFKGIKFEDIQSRNADPPIQPVFNNEMDLRYFDTTGNQYLHSPKLESIHSYKDMFYGISFNQEQPKMDKSLSAEQEL